MKSQQMPEDKVSVLRTRGGAYIHGLLKSNSVKIQQQQGQRLHMQGAALSSLSTLPSGTIPLSCSRSDSRFLPHVLLNPSLFSTVDPNMGPSCSLAAHPSLVSSNLSPASLFPPSPSHLFHTMYVLVFVYVCMPKLALIHVPSSMSFFLMQCAGC